MKNGAQQMMKAEKTIPRTLLAFSSETEPLPSVNFVMLFYKVGGDICLLLQFGKLNVSLSTYTGMTKKCDIATPRWSYLTSVSVNLPRDVSRGLRGAA